MVDVMTLLEEAAPKEGQACRTCVWLDARPADERAKWEEALADSGSWEGTRIVRAMAGVKARDKTASDWSPTIASVRNHRAGHSRNRQQGGNRVS